MDFKITKCIMYVFLILTSNHVHIMTGMYAPEYSCGTYTCEGDRIEQPCGCDDLCGVYGDCCPDYSTDTDLKSSQSTPGTSDRTIEESANTSSLKQSYGNMGDMESSQATPGTFDRMIEQNHNASSLKQSYVDTGDHFNRSDLQTMTISARTPQQETVRSHIDASTKADISDNASDRSGPSTSDQKQIVKGHNNDKTVTIDHTTDPHPNPDSSHVSCIRLTYTDAYLLVSKCPSTWQGGSVSEMCESTEPRNLPIYEIPVASERTRFSYRNTFCAICHNERPGDLRYWSSQLSCFGVQPSFVHYLRCEVFLFTEPSRRMCIPSIGHCPRENAVTDVTNRSVSHGEHDETIQKCTMYTDYLLNPYTYIPEYKNRYCAQCNEALHDPTLMCLKTWEAYLVPFTHLDQPLRDYLQLGKVGEHATLETGQSYCMKNEWYHGKSCLSWQCPGGFQKVQKDSKSPTFCEPSNMLRIEACTSNASDAHDMYMSMKNDKRFTYPNTREMEDMVCVQWHTNIGVALPVVIRYRKLTISTAVVTADTKARFTDNCTQLSRVGRQDHNHDAAYDLIRNRTQFPWVNFTNEKLLNSTDYDLSVETCDWTEGCKILQAQGELRSKAWVYNVGGYLGVCADDLEEYEIRKRTKRNRQLTDFYAQYFKHVGKETVNVSRNSAHSTGLGPLLLASGSSLIVAICVT